MRRTLDILIIIIGSFIFALAINLFVIPNEFGEGGVTGITIITYYLFKWSPALMNFILNGILLVIGFRFLDKKTIFYTIIATFLNSLFLHLTHEWMITSNEVIVNAIFGGILSGVGIGLIIRVGGTTAGTVILAKLTEKFLGWNISHGLLFFDLIVVFFSFFIIGIEKLMITIIMLYVAMKVMEFVIEGTNPKKAVTIISENSDIIAKRVNEVLDRGVTVYNGHGYYTKTEKDILYIVISSREVIKLKNIVKASDQNAFIAIHDVRDVFGKGFIDIAKS